jgi:SAM-dependent methyltransferase
VGDIDGTPTTAMRRWLAGALPDVRALAGRLPGIPTGLLEQLVVHYGPEVHAALRGAALDVGAVAKRAGLPAQCEPVLHDLNLFARVVAGRAARGDAQRFAKVPPGAIEGTGLPFPDESFDAVVCSLVLSYLRYPDDALAEMARVLAPGGTLVLSSMRRDADSSKLFADLIAHLESPATRDEDLPHPREALLAAARRFVNSAAELLRRAEEGTFRFYDDDELATLVRRAGFESVEAVRSLGDPPQAVVVVCRRP